MLPRVRASIVVIGDEILDGHTRDTNSGWLAARLSDIGVPLDRIVTVPDQIVAIGEALATEIARGEPRIILSSGGIGSTPDDLTMEAVAAFLGLPVEPHPRLDAHISRWAAQARDEGIAIPEEQEQAMRRMALVPAGAHLIGAGQGLLPGVGVDLRGGVAAGGSTIVVLPGIPSELQRIVDAGVTGLLDGLGRPDHVAELRHPYPESALTPVLDHLVDAYPDLRVGSYPDRECLIRLKGPKDQVEEAMAQVRAKLAELDRSDDARRMSARWQARWG